MCVRTNQSAIPVTSPGLQLAPGFCHFVAKRWMAAARTCTVMCKHQELAMPLTPLIAFHMACAIAATLTGAIALWARRHASPLPWLHRIAGYGFVLLMLATAISALFIRDFKLPNWAGFTPIHLLIPVTLGGLALSFWHLAHRRIAQHRSVMRKLYLGSCVVAGLFTLLPGRLLGNLLWQGLA